MKTDRNKLSKYFFFLFLLILILTTCKKVERTALIETGSIQTITSSSVTATINIIDLGEGITKYGHIVSTDKTLIVSPKQSSLLSPGRTGVFSSTINDLSSNTYYYLRAYATNSKGIFYGTSISFTTPMDITLPTLSTILLTGITQTTAIGGGNITNDGGASITVRGVCWNSSASPTITNSKTSDGTGSGSFISNLSGLTASTTYYVRAFATNSAGTAYGNEVTFTTIAVIPVLPTLSTTTITGITQTTATSGGNITSNGGASVTIRGICWNTSASPTITNSKTSDGTGSGSFVSNLTGLTASTTYYVRAYATNSAGTVYGNEVIFATSAVTPVVPTLSTTAITGITQTTASGGGNITSDGGASVTTRGICWSTSASPTIANTTTSDGTGSGSFVSNLAGLTASTIYYVRAYATNSAGTAYGNETSFTSNPVVVPTLATTDATSITLTTAVSGGNITADGGGSITFRGACWGTTANPTVGNSKTIDGNGTGSFISYLTGLLPGITYHVRAYATNSAGTAYGSDVSFTTSPIILGTITTTAVTSIALTTAISGGNISFDGGGSITSRGVCWATTTNPTISNSKTTDGTGTGSYISNLSGLVTGTTYHVRAYATNSAGTAYGNDVSFTTNPVVLATISTTSVTSISQTTAISGGNITSDGGGAITARGVCWATSASPTIFNSKTSDGTGNGSFTSNLIGLLSGITYYVRAYGTNSAGTAYGNDVSFTTLPAVLTVTDIDGNVYNTVNIGTQVWMKENLRTTKINDGISIPLAMGSNWDIAGWQGTPAYCWYNDNEGSYKNTYGGMYNGFTVNTGKLCPTGWHVPSLAEWETLATFLGGETVAGGKLKEVGIIHWNSPNNGATNESGFTGIPGGVRGNSGFSGMSDNGDWWSSTSTWYGRLYSAGTDLQIPYLDTSYGLSIRCVKD